MSSSGRYNRDLTSAKMLEADLLRQMDKEPEICTRFGCGKKLTMEEKLYGNKCFNHSITEEIDITQFIKIKKRGKRGI